MFTLTSIYSRFPRTRMSGRLRQLLLSVLIQFHDSHHLDTIQLVRAACARR